MVPLSDRQHIKVIDWVAKDPPTYVRLCKRKGCMDHIGVVWELDEGCKASIFAIRISDRANLKTML